MLIKFFTLVAVIIGSYLFYKLTKASEKQVKLTGQQLEDENFNKAIANLGSDKESVLLGAIYGLYETAVKNENKRKTICHLFCARIKEITSKKEYQVKYRYKPSEEIQTILDYLTQKNKDEKNNDIRLPFKNIDISLEESYLHGVNLRKANLEGAFLFKANLEQASLYIANLEEAILFEASLYIANLEQASLYKANLQKANLQKANLQGAILYKANLEGANLEGANLQGATLEEATLEEAKLKETRFHHAIIDDRTTFPENYSLEENNYYKSDPLTDSEIEEINKWNPFFSLEKGHTYYRILKK